MTPSDTTAAATWRVLVCSLVVLAGMGAGLGTVQAQDNTAYYYGDAVSEDGSTLPAGTVIKAVTEEDGSNETLDQITMESAGEYGGAGLGEKKLQVPATVDGPVYFVAENDLGTFTASETVQEPSGGTQRLDLTFPPGAAESRPYFDVSGLQPTDETVIEGETVDVNATVENRGSEQGTQTVSLTVDGQSTGSTEVTLGPGSQETVSFAIDTATLGAGNYTYTVASDDTSQSGDLTVDARRATFTVDGFSPTEQTVVEGDLINASATVTNEGNAEGTQTVTLEAGGTTLASSDVTLAAGGEQTVTFSDVSTDPLAPGTYTYGVYTDNESQTGTLTVDDSQATVAVSGLDPASVTVVRGDRIDASATLTNNGNAEATQTISLDAGGTTLASQDVTLAAGESRTVEFTGASTDPLAAGTYTHGVFSANDSSTGELTVEARRTDFVVSGLTPADRTLTVGEEFAVSATVTNAGTIEGTQTVAFRVDGQRYGSEGVTLAPGEERTLSFAPVDTAELGPGSYVHEVASANDSQVGTLVVESEAPATFAVTDLRPPDTAVDAGQSFDVEAVLRNDGGQSGTQQIQFRLNGTTIERQEISLDSGEQTTVTFTGIGTDSLEPGTYTYRVRSDDDSRVGTLTVDSTDGTDEGETASFTISAVEPVGATVTEGASITISGTVTNSGRASGTQRVRLFVDGETVQSESVTLEPGAERTVTHTVDSRALDTGSHVYRVVTNDDQQAESFRITAESQSTPTPQPSSVTATPPESQPTATETPPPQPSTPSPTPPPTPPGTLTETTTDPSTETAQSTTTEDDSGGGGLLPSGLFGTVLLWVGVPLLVIYGILKALAIYLGY